MRSIVLVLTLVLASFALALLAPAASARRVVHIPTLRELCPASSDWDKLVKCFARQGKHEILRDERTVKAVYFAPSARLAGIYMFTLRGKQWEQRGELRLRQELELLALQRVRFGRHDAYRMDVGFTTAPWFSIDGETSMQSLLAQRHSVVCFDAFGCVHAVVACDMLVRGRAMHAFRGTLVYEAGMLRVTGDRANAGPFCIQPEDVLRLDQ